ncbi:MAG: hypothetical protein KBD66_01695 [Candidatus Doudnabacteria bacterium]|nr:hypothetical protein [Candidatus Doudnabacteria bacterium]
MLFSKKTQNVFFASLLLGVVAFTFMDVTPAHAALVNCGNGDGGTVADACKFSDFFNAAIGLIDYLLAGVAVVAVGGVVWGGVLMVTSNGNDSKVKSGKTAVKNAVVGLIIVLAAFLMVRSVFTILGFKGGDAPLSNPGGFTDPNSGFQLIDPGNTNGVPGVTPTIDGGSQLPAPSGSTQELAQKALQTLGEKCFYDFHVSGLGKGDGATALDNMRDTAAGRPAKTSLYGDGKGKTVNLEPRMLQSMLAIYQAGYTSICRISSIAGSDHSEDSAHYDGKAFDMENVTNAAQILAICRQYGARLVLNETTDLHCGW